MRAKQFILLAFLFAFIDTKAQAPYIEKRVDICFTPNTVVWPVCFDFSDNGVFIGSICGGYDVVLSKIDSIGTIHWVDSIAGSCFEFLPPKGNIIHTQNHIFTSTYSNSYDGGIQNFHGPFDCSTPSGTPYTDIVLIKTSVDGVEKWAKCYGGQNPDAPCKLYFSPNKSSIILAGSITVSNVGDYQNPLSNINEQDIWLVEVDTANGNIVREKCFGTSTYSDHLYDMIPTHDQGYLLTGTTGLPQHFWAEAMMIKIDSDWNEEWRTILPTPKQENGMLVVEDTLTGSIYWLINSDETDSLFHTTHYNTQNPGNDNTNNWLVKLYSNGDTAWVKFVGTPYYEDLFPSTFPNNTSSSIIMNENHEIITITNSYTDFIENSPLLQIRFMKLDTNGVILVQKDISELEQVHDIVALGNDRYLCLAQILDDNCPFQLITLGNSVGLEEQVLNPINIFPNPAQDFVSIELPNNYNKAQLNIYNLTGQLISQKQITQSNSSIGIPSGQTPIPELGNGMYIFVIQNEDKIIGRQQVLVAR